MTNVTMTPDIRALVSMGQSFCDVVKALTDAFSRAEGTIPEDALVPACEKVQAALEGMHRELVKMQPAATDGACEAYQAAIRTIATLHDGIETCRWRLLEHNADKEKLAESLVFTTPEDVERYLANL